MANIESPLVCVFSHEKENISQHNKSLLDRLGMYSSRISGNKKKIIYDYPTVYLYKHESNGMYKVYIGETSDILRRTAEHFDMSKKVGSHWQKILKKPQTEMFVMGHNHFNKSLTLDIENRLILYMSCVEKVEKIYNSRGNSQNDYYTSNEFAQIFSKLWSKLRRYDKNLFPKESEITDSAIFKASPFHKLTNEQYAAKLEIVYKVKQALEKSERGQVIFVEGGVGTGKTVLNSSLFYDLNYYDEDDSEQKRISSYLLVNHEEQLTVYREIAKRLNIYKDKEGNVNKPTRFINSHTEDNPVDVVLVDEAHLTLTQGNQGYTGKNHLLDIIARARVTVIMFDKKQILRTDQYWEAQMLQELKAKAGKNHVKLEHQLRINADNGTLKWIRDFIDKQKVRKIPSDKRGYEIEIFDDPKSLHDAIKEKAKCEDEGLSRIVATFDWEFKAKKSKNHVGPYEVIIGKWHLPWNLQTKVTAQDRKKIKKLSWAEQKHTINEVGSTYTVQGFDLNYVGVILGPSVKYRNGKVIFDPSYSKNKKAVQRRTLENGSKIEFAEMLLRNETNVLLTRGVKGLYIYAQDEQLRGALNNARK